MIRPGVKRRVGDRWLTPQPHECVFRAGAGPEPPLTQPVTAKLAVGYDFSGIDSTVTVTGSGISLVTDSSGNGNDGTQTNDARRMLYGSATINGNLVADAGVTDLYVNMPDTIANFTQEGQPPFHSFCVFQVANWVNLGTVYNFQTAGASPRHAIRISTSGGNRIEARLPRAGGLFTSLLSNETSLTTGVTYVAELIADGSNAGLYVNDGTPALAIGTASNSGDALPVRLVGDNTVSLEGLIGAVYIFNAELSLSERAEWRAFLAQRWGVTL